MPDEAKSGIMVSPLVTTDWLAEHLDEPGVKPLDATWHLPDAGRDAAAEFLATHIPGAHFFDLDATSETAGPLPHMLPAAAHFSARMRALGLDNDDFVVAYDSGPVHAAARAWWMFRVFGHGRVAILDGGLEKWRAEGHPVAAGAAGPGAGNITVSAANPDMVAGLDDVRRALQSAAATILDARGPGRFSGTEAEPRPGLRSGHMPGAKNLCSADLYDEQGCMKDIPILARLFAGAGVDMTRPVITTCGSGVTAASLSLALLLTGKKDVRLYDGSWAEWGGRDDTEVVSIPAGTGDPE